MDESSSCVRILERDGRGRGRRGPPAHLIDETRDSRRAWKEEAMDWVRQFVQRPFERENEGEHDVEAFLPLDRSRMGESDEKK